MLKLCSKLSYLWWDLKNAKRVMKNRECGLLSQKTNSAQALSLEKQMRAMETVEGPWFSRTIHQMNESGYSRASSAGEVQEGVGTRSNILALQELASSQTGSIRFSRYFINEINYKYFSYSSSVLLFYKIKKLCFLWQSKY